MQGLKRAGTTTLAAAAVVALLLSTPSTGSGADIADEGRRVFREIAGIGCAGCHGEYAEGDLGVGPFIRGATEGSIRAAIEGIGEMVIVRNAISEDEIAAVATYLQSLGSTQVARTLVKRGRFFPGDVSVRPGATLQVIINNAGFSEARFASDNMAIDELPIAARSTAALIWQAPGDDGAYSLHCTNCKLTDQFFTITVDSNAAAFKSPAQTGQ